ncbi:hypothetical protein Ciccas_005553 [Cichlidogyrus casuarinus]|uniref:Phosphatidylinositol-4,5-bisphosphate 3-kinase n=1 Tax=Cichlidogyrus casuarinus TaxID=1844966 RepID=A0ABD2Q8D9_9PLAT
MRELLKFLIVINLENQYVTHLEITSIDEHIRKREDIKYDPKDYQFEFVNKEGKAQIVEYDGWSLVKLWEVNFFFDTLSNCFTSEETILRFEKSFGLLEADSYMIEQLTSGQKFNCTHDAFLKDPEAQHFHACVDQLIRVEFEKQQQYSLDDYLFKYYPSATFDARDAQFTKDEEKKTVKIFFPNADLLCANQIENQEDLYHDCAYSIEECNCPIKYKHDNSYQFQSKISVNIHDPIETLLRKSLKKLQLNMPQVQVQGIDDYLIKWRCRRQYLDHRKRRFSEDKLLMECWRAGEIPSLTIVLKKLQFRSNLTERLQLKQSETVARIKNGSLYYDKLEMPETVRISKSSDDEDTENVSNRSSLVQSETDEKILAYSFAINYFLDPCFHQVNSTKKNMDKVEMFTACRFMDEHFHEEPIEDVEIWIKCALFVGEAQISTKKTVFLPKSMIFSHVKEKMSAEKECFDVDKALLISLPLDCYPLPSCTKLCIAVYRESKDQLRKGAMNNPLWWINVGLFDSEQRIKCDVISLNLASVENAFLTRCTSSSPDESPFFPLDMAVNGQQHLFNVELRVKLNEPPIPLAELNSNEMMEKASNYMEPDLGQMNEDDESKLKRFLDRYWCLDKNELRNMRDYIWKHRTYIVMRWPDFLPIVLKNMPWRKMGAIYLRETLLVGCPFDIDPVTALMLFGPGENDSSTQERAIAVLEKLTNEMVEVYLWHMVQYHMPIDHSDYQDDDQLKLCTYEILFKTDDDLRQDCLVTHLFQIMESYWIDDKLPFRFNHYNVLPCPGNTGYIEIIENAETLRIIRTRYGNICNWLKASVNNDSTELKNAVERFAVSCVSYSVGTYILGAGDRHSSNLMVTKKGRVNFGHILGDKKEPYFIGCQRDMFDIVLVDDFAEIFNDSQFSKQYKSDEEVASRMDKLWTPFRNCCLTAYLSLRARADKLVNLVLLTRGCKLKNLQDEKAINYLQNALQLGASEDEAKDHFLQKMNVSITNQQDTTKWWTLHEKARACNSFKC